MKGTQLEVLHGIKASLEQELEVTLVSVAETWGTSPRPVGSLFAINRAGDIYGSVSGGCLEEDLIEHLKNHRVSKPEFLLYGETEEERHRFGLPCGGTIKLILQPFNNLENVNTLIDTINQRKVIECITDIASGEVYLSDIQHHQSPSMSDSLWRNVFGPSHRIIVIGAGQISQYLAEMALMLNYDVHICDPRPEYYSQWNIDGVALSKRYPDDMIKEIVIDRRTAIITLTHDPKLDDLALLACVNSSAFYIGSLGSKRTTAARKQRLMEYFEFSQCDVDKIQGPAGISIKSKTPPEIAISILTEVTSYKNQAP